ncbi:MAG: tetratricopeptide repeat protein [Candidatus Acidiferrales bacterium]
MTQTAKTRREMLEAFVEKNPGDAFARYGLALECARLGDNQAAKAQFERLLADHPNYVAGYHQFGHLLARLNLPEEAREIWNKGISAATHAGDFHARDEMQAALSALAP